MPAIESFAAESLQLLPPPLINSIQQAKLPSLQDGPRDAVICGLLADFEGGKADSLLANVPQHRQSACLSGLWLIAGDIDRSHTISQDIDTAEGSFLHGIMHRREEDFGNAKYWFRRVGGHPVIDQLTEHFNDYGDPHQFVDACSDAIRSSDHTDCQAIQWAEWQLLMSHLLVG